MKFAGTTMTVYIIPDNNILGQLEAYQFNII